MFKAVQPVIARTLVRPLNYEIPACRGTRTLELAAAQEKLLDTRDTADRVIDAVVEEMLKELSW